MKPMPLTHFLPVLEAPKPRQLEAPRVDLHLVSSRPDPEPEPEPVGLFAEFQQPAEDPYEEGYLAGWDAAQADAEQRRLEEEARFEQRLADARLAWTKEQGDLIASGVQKALGAIERGICDSAERILKQVIDAALRERAVSEFADSIRQLLRDGEAGVVTIHAPLDLIEGLEGQLAGVGSIEFVENPGAEIWVRVDQTLIETRFSTWRSALQIQG